ncbi:MAG TPA: YMGG-like glycine zipper-containing protein [Pyrinomonadaceae bacterium]|nr:YMGG-like glycine zipper-containing protein [Pyrinomonadaceae bacterium]
MVRKTMAALMIALVFAAGASLTQAQRQPYRGTYRSMQQLLSRIGTGTDLLLSRVNTRNRTSVYDRNIQADLGSSVQSLSSTVMQLRERFNSRTSTTADVQEVLNSAALVDRIIRGNTTDAVTLRTWTNLRADLNQLASVYGLRWSNVSQTNAYPSNNPPTQYGVSRLTGTYRLDPSRSDDPGQAADRATQSLGYGDRARIRDQVAARLESPDQIAIELRGRDVTLASSRAPQITFTADGTERVETAPNGRSIRARATLNGEQLIVSSTGDFGNQFNVTFDLIDNGRALSVTRRVYVQGLSRPVVVQSVYEKTSDVARFDINTGPQTYPNPGNTTTANGDFVITNGETVIGVLENGLSTQTAHEGDRFTMTVRQPAQYEGAVIEGHVSNIQRSGRLTGRSQMTLNFDTIRLRDGGSYRFAGILESVRTTQGDVVRVDNEGTVRDTSQTTKTEQRAAIGTAVGAIIGAIAGGGKGAAIGAIVGAGGGAGSVYVQGRDDLDLGAGTELTIRASGPR